LKLRVPGKKLGPKISVIDQSIDLSSPESKVENRHVPETTAVLGTLQGNSGILFLILTIVRMATSPFKELMRVFIPTFVFPRILT
jgi:hypothetical protein